MRWILGIIAIVLLLGNASSVFAATSTDVTVTARGVVLGGPTSFTVTRISDYEVEIAWSKNPLAENTLIRRAIGRWPEDRNDGVLVYYGSGEDATDWIDMEATSARAFYRAWSESSEEVWSEEYAEGFTRGVGMTLIAIIILTLGLLGFSIHYKNHALMFLAAAAGIALAIYGFSNMSGSGQDAYWVLGIIGAVLAIVAAMMAGLSMRSGPSGDIESVDDAYARELREGRPSRKRQRG